MKRLMVLVVGLVFLFCASAFAADKPAAATATKAAPVAAEPVKAPAKVTKMSATGKVTEISDTALKIERTVKGKAEMKEFVLEKPAKAKVGDKVKVSYIEKEGKNVASKVTKVVVKKKAAKAAAKPAEEKPAAPAPETPAAK
jgi:hypothetical protein